MPTRLSRALARVLPALLLIVVGLVAALFRGRRTPRPEIPASTVPAPVMAAAPGLRRWWPAFVFAGLLLGGGVILALLPDDAGEAPVTILSRTEIPRTEPETRMAVSPPGEPDRVGPNASVAATPTAEASGRPSVVPPTGNAGVGPHATDDRGDGRASQDDVAGASPSDGTKLPGQALAEANAAPVPRETSGSPAPRDPATDASQPRETTAEAPSGARTDPADPARRPPTGDPSGAAPAVTRILSVEARGGGRLSVTGRATAGSSVRLYLNETLVAPARIGRDGLVTFVIGGGVKPGGYEVRLDEVDGASGAVRSRVEVPFAVPDGEGAATTEAAPSRPEADPAIVFVPEVKTARIVRGDSLWEISRRTYGEGDRYTAIYDANQDQIRNPDLIYPGQVFVLPSEGGPGENPPNKGLPGKDLPGADAGGAGRDGMSDRGTPN